MTRGLMGGAWLAAIYRDVGATVLRWRTDGFQNEISMGKLLFKGLLSAALLAVVPLSGTAPAIAEVRFGNNVGIGGHDVSGQRFNGNRRGHYIIHDAKPSREGCSWRRNGDGSRTKVCHLQRKRN